jgi:Fe-S-cluster-containing hydrogenase component 2
MAKRMREIIQIDEELCNGCGDCILGCAEGALQIINGKAKLVSDNLCDGFGNCVGTCPQNAITIIRREADDFSEAAVEERLDAVPPVSPVVHHAPALPQAHAGGCPGSAMRMFDVPAVNAGQAENVGEVSSQLSQWPVQLMLVPPTAPFLKGRDILLAADCCPFAFADFHHRFLSGKALLVGCPKLDDLNHYRHKLEDIFRDSGCTGVTVMMMEVPCCGGLKMIAQQALQASGRDIPLKEVIVGVRGNILRESVIA